MSLATFTDAKPRGKSTQRRNTPGEAKPRGKSTEIDAIEQRRKKLGISQATLCRRAVVDVGNYRGLLTGGLPQRRTLIKLNRALDGFVKQTPAHALALYRSAFTAFALKTGLDPRHVDTPPSNCNFGIHAEIGRARQAAFYITVTALDVPRPSLRAVYDKAAASKAIKDVEGRREQDKAYDALIVEMGRLLTGSDLT